MKYGEEMRKRMFVQDPIEQEMNCVLGIAGEAGEIADWYKKDLYHPHVVMKLPELRKEIGDVLWYLSVLNSLLFGDTLTDVAKDNVRKLQERYPDRYGDLTTDDIVL